MMNTHQKGFETRVFRPKCLTVEPKIRAVRDTWRIMSRLRSNAVSGEFAALSKVFLENNKSG
jgi:hypothetical protein